MGCAEQVEVLGTIDLVLGSKWGTSLPFNGLIDEVAIYDRVLSPSEIKAIYESEK